MYRVNNLDVRNEILKRAKALKKTEYRNVYISRDNTPRERFERRMLEEQLKTRTAMGESNLTIRRGRIVEGKERQFEPR